MIVYRQLAYVKRENLGFNKDQVLVLTLDDPKVKSQTEALKTELKKIPVCAGCCIA